MSAVLADGVLAVVKAATEPLIDEIKALRRQVADLERAKGVGDVDARLRALEKAMGIR